MRLLQQGYCPCCKQGNNEHTEDCDNEEVFVPKWEQAEEEVYRYKNIFGDDFYIELQSHDTYDQRIGNQRILQLAQKTDTKFIITFDAHMKDGSEKTRDIHRKFVEISQSGREVGETYKDCYQQDMQTMYDILVPQLGKDIVDQAVRHTGALADSCEDIELDIGRDPLMPHIEPPKQYKSQKEYLQYLIEEGWKNRGLHAFSPEKQSQYRERIEQELDVLEYLDFIGYFLILHKFMTEFKKQEIPLGYARGSGAGCLILWLLGVTEIDSIRWDLDFSRFANKGRRSVADVDIDISKRKRGEALRIIDEMFGKDNVAHLATFNTLSAKVAIKDLGKVFNDNPDSVYANRIPYRVREDMANLIPEGVNIQEAVEASGKMKRYQEEFPLLFEYVEAVQGLPKSVGCHASAVIIADNPIVDYTPVMLNKDGRIMAHIEMHNAERDLGLVKFDFLGLISLDTIQDTLDLAGLTWENIDLSHLNLDDKEVLANIYATGDTLGIFQMESYVAQDLFRNMFDGVPKDEYHIEDVIAVNAMNRPAILSVGMHNKYIKGKKNPDQVEYLHPDVEPILNKTYSVLLYQEQALSVFRLAGFPEEEVDNARRSIGKKIQEEMDALYDDFHKGLKQRKWSDEQIQKMWDLIEAQATYSFNRSHSVSYALLSYVTAYLKHYYPAQFMTALLVSEIGDYEQTAKYLDACKTMGIKVLHPDINKAKDYYSIHDNQIVFGFNSIKGIGSEISTTIYKERQKNGDYSSLEDFLSRVKAGRGVVVPLIKAGAFGLSKNNTLREYFKLTYEPNQWIPRKSSPSRADLIKITGKDITTADFRKISKEDRIEIFNKHKLEQYNKSEKNRRLKHWVEFRDKYIDKDESMYEYETLSIFINGSPFDSYSKLFEEFSTFKDGDDGIFIGGTITDIQKKKDKNNNQFAYIHVLTVHDGIIEGLLFASMYSKYRDLIEKGNNIVCLAKKSGSQFIPSDMESFDKWKERIKQRRKRKRKEEALAKKLKNK